MNNNQGGNNLSGKHQPTSNNRRAENKDNLDSRSNEENDTKGDDVTHNKKDVQNDRKKVKSTDRN